MPLLYDLMLHGPSWFLFFSSLALLLGVFGLIHKLYQDRIAALKDASRDTERACDNRVKVAEAEARTAVSEARIARSAADDLKGLADPDKIEEYRQRTARAEAKLTETQAELADMKADVAEERRELEVALDALEAEQAIAKIVLSPTPQGRDPRANLWDYLAKHSSDPDPDETP